MTTMDTITAHKIAEDKRNAARAALAPYEHGDLVVVVVDGGKPQVGVVDRPHLGVRVGAQEQYIDAPERLRGPAASNGALRWSEVEEWHWGRPVSLASMERVAIVRRATDEDIDATTGPAGWRSAREAVIRGY
jgi:hypothetical protein